MWVGAVSRGFFFFPQPFDQKRLRSRYARAEGVSSFGVVAKREHLYEARFLLLCVMIRTEQKTLK